MSKFDAITWNKLMVLGSKQGTIRLRDFAEEARLSEEEAHSFLEEVFPEGSGLRLKVDKGITWIELDASAVQYLLPVTPAEWKQLHRLVESAPVEAFQQAAFQSLKRKVTDSGPIQAVMDMLDQLQLWDQHLTPEEQAFVNMLDEAVSSKRLLKLGTGNKYYHIFPCKVLHLEGHLSLIGEDLQDHCLMVFPLKELREATIVPTTSSAKVTHYELEEFIGCVRSMNERETRLILKIHQAHMVNLFPDHHFLGKPCMVTNPNGDLIWAAYVEPCEALFDWVSSLGDHVEILDPTRFKEQYFTYCEEKLRKIA